MAYYMRYISVDEREITLSTLEEALRRLDSAYSITRDQTQSSEMGTLMHSNTPYGEIEINRTGDELFDEEIGELKDFLEDAGGKGKHTVLQVLETAKASVAVQLLHQGRSTEDTLSKIDPLWNWLFENRSGLLQVDGEGFYRGPALILEE